MKSRLTCSLALSVWATLQPIAGAAVNESGFEAGTPGASATDLAGWTCDPAGSARIETSGATAGAAHGGSRFLQVDPGAAATRTLGASEWDDGQKIAWVDFWIRPTGDARPEVETSLDADGARFAFVRQEEAGTIYAFDGDGRGGGRAIPVGSFACAENGAADRWIRLTVREDFSRQRGDVFVDGELAAADLGLDNPAPKSRPTAWSVTGGEGSSVDDLTIAPANPLFPDADNDGLPDAYENAHGLDAFRDDRALDRDGDGLSNLEEFRRGTDPARAGAGGAAENAARLVYVDGAQGDDTFSGAFSYRTGDDGPKATLSGAIDAAADRGTILLLPAPAGYAEAVIDTHGKDLTIKTLGPIRINRPSKP